MEIPIGNFFQVTVNSNRLSHFVDDIKRQIDDHEEKIGQISKGMNGMLTIMNDRLKKGEQRLQYELQKMRKMNQQQFNYFRLFLKDVDKKSFQRIDQFQGTLVMFNNRINDIKQNIQEDMAIKFSYFEKKLQSTLSSQELEKRLMKGQQQMRNKHNELQNRLIQKLKILQNDGERYKNDIKTKFDIEQGQQLREYSQKCLSNRISCRSRSKKRLKSHRNATLYQNQDDIDHINNKISQLENKLKQQKQINLISNNKVVKINQNVTNLNHNAEDKPREPKEIQAKIINKLSKIQQIISNRLGQCERSISKVTNRHEIIDEQIGIIGRRVEKQKNRVSEVVNNFKKIEQKKVDDKVIEGLKNAIKKLTKQYEQNIDTKVNIDLFQRQKSKILQRIHLLNDSLIQKAQKSEIKKGFSFLEQKIKQIIIVLAEQRSYNKDSATKKIPFKCLSCDKQLQCNNLQQNNAYQRYFRDSTTSSGRCSTTQLRKRIRVVNNSMSVNDD